MSAVQTRIGLFGGPLDGLTFQPREYPEALRRWTIGVRVWVYQLERGKNRYRCSHFYPRTDNLKSPLACVHCGCVQISTRGGGYCAIDCQGKQKP